MGKNKYITTYDQNKVIGTTGLMIILKNLQAWYIYTSYIIPENPYRGLKYIHVFVYVV